MALRRGEGGDEDAALAALAAHQVHLAGDGLVVLHGLAQHGFALGIAVEEMGHVLADEIRRLAVVLQDIKQGLVGLAQYSGFVHHHKGGGDAAKHAARVAQRVLHRVRHGFQGGGNLFQLAVEVADEALLEAPLGLAQGEGLDVAQRQQNHARAKDEQHGHDDHEHRARAQDGQQGAPVLHFEGVKGGLGLLALLNDGLLDDVLDLAPFLGFFCVQKRRGGLGVALDGQAHNLGLEGVGFVPQGRQRGESIAHGLLGQLLRRAQGLFELLVGVFVVLRSGFVGGVQHHVARGLLGLQPLGVHLLKLAQ